MTTYNELIQRDELFWIKPQYMFDCWLDDDGAICWVDENQNCVCSFRDFVLLPITPNVTHVRDSDGEFIGSITMNPNDDYDCFLNCLVKVIILALDYGISCNING